MSVHTMKEFHYGVTGQKFDLRQLFDGTDESVGYIVSEVSKDGEGKILGVFPPGRYPDASDLFKSIVTPML